MRWCSVQVVMGVEIALVDQVVSCLMNTVGFETECSRLEEGPGSTESVCSVGE